jgi:hypothetical protein
MAPASPDGTGLARSSLDGGSLGNRAFGGGTFDRCDLTRRSFDGGGFTADSAIEHGEAYGNAGLADLFAGLLGSVAILARVFDRASGLAERIEAAGHDVLADGIGCVQQQLPMGGPLFEEGVFGGGEGIVTCGDVGGGFDTANEHGWRRIGQDAADALDHTFPDALAEVAHGLAGGGQSAEQGISDGGLVGLGFGDRRVGRRGVGNWRLTGWRRGRGR